MPLTLHAFSVLLVPTFTIGRPLARIPSFQADNPHHALSRAQPCRASRLVPCQDSTPRHDCESSWPGTGNRPRSPACPDDGRLNTYIHPARHLVVPAVKTKDSQKVLLDAARQPVPAAQSALFLQDLVDDQSHDDLNNDPADATANQLPGNGCDIKATRRCTTASNQRPEQTSAADPANGTSNQVANLAEVGVLDHFAPGGSTCRTTDHLGNK